MPVARRLLFVLLALLVVAVWGYVPVVSADTPTPTDTATPAPTASPTVTPQSTTAISSFNEDDVPNYHVGGVAFLGTTVTLPIIWNNGVAVVFALWVVMLVWVLFKFVSGVITAVLGG
jgi:hypothetical protein